MITAQEQKAIDLNSEYFGVPVSTLMENAGREVAKVVQQICKGKTIHIYCGSGGNGGDGFVCARYLKKYKPKVFVLGAPKSEPTLSNYEKVKGMCTHISNRNSLPKKSPNIIIDAIFGTGIRGDLSLIYMETINHINKSKAVKISIDIPSGKDPDTGEGKGVEPKMILSLHDTKPGFPGAKVLDIGVPHKALTHCGPGDAFLVQPHREPDSHKGDNGRVLVVAGSRDFTGAPLLAIDAALASLRSGADLSILASPKRVANLAAHRPDLITISLDGGYLTTDHISKIRPELGKADAVLLGPGISRKPQTKRFMDAFLPSIEVPLVLDADALKLVDPELIPRKTVLTPHKGEFKKLSGKLPTESNAKKFAKDHKCIIILKGQVDIITNGTKTKYNDTGNSGMTIGGSGDILAGIVTGLLAQGVEPFKAACAAAWVNGTVGDILEQKYGYGFLASDFLEEIPKVLFSKL